MGESKLTVAVGAVCVAVALAIGAVLLFDGHGLSARSSPRSSSSFGWLVATAVPATWKPLAIDGGATVLLQPPGFRQVHSDPGTVSAAVIENGAYAAYLNATPRQGDEQLRGWDRSRLDHLLGENASSAHEVASLQLAAIQGDLWSCVIDRYVTKVGQHHFTEIACLVKGAKHESVVVAAAGTSDWQRFHRTLEQAVATFKVH